MDPRRAVDLAVLFVDRADALKQPLVLDPPGRRPAALPGMKARPRDPEHAAHRLDRVLGLLRRDEPEDHRRVSLSFSLLCQEMVVDVFFWSERDRSRRP